MQLQRSNVPCPACQAPIGKSDLSVGCGSCGHQFTAPPSPQPNGSKWLLICLLVSIVLGWNEASAARAREEQSAREMSARDSRHQSHVRALTAQLQKLRLAQTQSFHRRTGLPDPGPFPAPVAAAGSGRPEEARADIDFLESLSLRWPEHPEVHFQLSIAYDRLGAGPDWSAKSFMHAKKAIKLDPTYKSRFQPFIRNSQVARKVARVIHEIIEKSADQKLPDAEASRYAEEIGRILGENRPAQTPRAGRAPDSAGLAEQLADPAGRQQLRQHYEMQESVAPGERR